MKSEIFGQSSGRIKPVDHFSNCPQCGCKDLLDVNPDVACMKCDWDSTSWDVSRGGMDSLGKAAREFGFLEVATEQIVPMNIEAKGA